MMNFVAFLFGTAFVTVNGWLMISMLEWKSPILGRAERWMMGFVLGLTITMYATFLAHVFAGVPLSRLGFLGIQGLLLVMLLGIAVFFVPLFFTVRSQSNEIESPNMGNEERRPNSENPWRSWPLWLRVTIVVLAAWTLVKFVAMGTLLISTPTYFDDAIDNWNLRGKLFFTDQALTLTLPGDSPESVSAISAYPPPVPLFKAFLASLAGTWNEGLINGVHILWYLACIALVFLFLRRETNALWALFGAYVAASLPLFLMHGTNPYTDLFMAVHLFIAVTLAYRMLTMADQTMASQRNALVRLSAVAVGILPFTKNEGLLLYLPPLFLIIIIGIIRERMRRQLKERHGSQAAKQNVVLPILWYLGALTLLAFPWIAWKWSYGMPFGNAKSVSGFAIAWQPRVLHALAVSTLFEGNWNLLFAAFPVALVFRWRAACTTPLLALTAFVLIAFIGQAFLYLFTSLSVEALYQTGYARGLIHLVPLIVVLTVLLLRDVLENGE